VPKKRSKLLKKKGSMDITSPKIPKSGVIAPMVDNDSKTQTHFNMTQDPSILNPAERMDSPFESSKSPLMPLPFEASKSPFTDSKTQVRNLRKKDPQDEYLENIPRPTKIKTFKVSNLNEDMDRKQHGYAAHLSTVMIHIHGGGFVCMSSSSHQHYLIKWAKKLDIPIFSIDYRLAPEVKTPVLANDCINAYLWILYFVECVLGIQIKNLILTGDSAGGNITFVLTNWCIANGIR
jgi:acetyl esterase/lipase